MHIFQAEEITLTIGQAFELAYKKFLDSKGKDLENQKQSLVLQKRIEILEQENKELKKRLSEVAKIKGDNDVKQYMRENNVSLYLKLQFSPYGGAAVAECKQNQMDKFEAFYNFIDKIKNVRWP